MTHRELTSEERAVLADCLNTEAYLEAYKADPNTIPDAWWKHACDWCDQKYVPIKAEWDETTANIKDAIARLDASLEAESKEAVRAILQAAKTTLLLQLPPEPERYAPAENAIRDKVARWKPEYEQRKAEMGAGYKNAAQRYADYLVERAAEQEAATASAAESAKIRQMEKAALVDEIVAKVKAALSPA